MISLTLLSLDADTILTLYEKRGKMKGRVRLDPRPVVAGPLFIRSSHCHTSTLEGSFLASPPANFKGVRYGLGLANQAKHPL